MFDKFSTIVNKMNRAGSSKTPFLFGINFELSEGFFISNPLEQDYILFEINGTGNIPAHHNPLGEYKFDYFPIGIEDYKKKFDKAIDEMTTGGVDLINLTIKTPIETSLSINEIFEHSNSKYKILIPNKFVCFSPETFVRTHDGKMYSYPMKGTINAGTPNARELIIDNEKEIKEHSTAVSLIEKDLSRIASNVRTTKFRYIDEITNHKGKLLQVSSEVQGDLPIDFFENIGTHISCLLPGGSIAGHPRDKALHIISNSEREPRGYYTGVFGYFDGKNIDCGVLIRFIEQEKDKLYFRSGGGITLNSLCENEYQEVLEKVYLPF